MLRLRPVRARIYQPIFRYGVLATDLYYIVASGVVFWAVPMVLKFNLGPIPLYLISGPGAMLVSYGFFRWTRGGKEAGWLQHQWKALLNHPLERGTLAADRIHNPPYPWLK
jgi:hypothetical protein